MDEGKREKRKKGGWWAVGVSGHQPASPTPRVVMGRATREQMSVLRVAAQRGQLSRTGLSCCTP